MISVAAIVQLKCERGRWGGVAEGRSPSNMFRAAGPVYRRRSTSLKPASRYYRGLFDPMPLSAALLAAFTFVAIMPFLWLACACFKQQDDVFASLFLPLRHLDRLTTG